MAEDTKFVSLKRTKEDKRQDMGSPCSVESIMPDYPWGTCINLEQDELEKLKISKLPALGTEIVVTAKVRVTRCEESSYETPDGKHTERRSLALQITDLALP